MEYPNILNGAMFRMREVVGMDNKTEMKLMPINRAAWATLLLWELADQCKEIKVLPGVN
jgi:hypothetical protein